jgi:hypothetical protein
VWTRDTAGNPVLRQEEENIYPILNSDLIYEPTKNTLTSVPERRISYLERNLWKRFAPQQKWERRMES